MPVLTAEPVTRLELDQEPLSQTSATSPAVEARSTVFSTAVAVPLRRQKLSRQFVATLRRMFVSAAGTSRPRRDSYPRRYEFLERALIAREMGRL